MIEIKNAGDRRRLRRLALGAQGLLQAQPFGRGLSGARTAIEHIGYVQLDTISVVERAHHHVVHSRVPGYQATMADRLLQRGEIFEYWSHAAAFLPMRDFRYSLPYKHAIKSGQTHWFKNPDHTLMNELLQRVRVDGPLRARDVESGRPAQGGWWNWKPAKKALEQLYMQGDLMVCDRQGFQKTYDLTERVLPAAVDTRVPSAAEMAEHLLDQQLRCHGVVSLKGLTYQRRQSNLRRAMKTLLDQRLSDGLMQTLRLKSGDVFNIESGALERPLTRVNKRLRILSPFDNSVIQRERLSSLFDYDYQIECYVPSHKRQYGYFCLPLLYGDAFVGRMDCKAHRKERCLEIKALHFEVHSGDSDALMAAFVPAVEAFMAFQDCTRVRLTRVDPAAYQQPLERALAGLR